MEMEQGGTVTRALKGFKEGDSDAFDALWTAYFQRLAALAGRAFTFTADGEDAALSAFKTFHRRARLGEFPKLDDSDDLWVVLQMLLWQKVSEIRRRRQAQKHGGNHTIVQASALIHEEEDDGLAALAVSKDDPTKSVEMADLMDMLMSHISDPKMREIIELKKEGVATNEEIAQRLGIGIASVYRKLNRVKEIWEPILDRL
jgi:DNA-directed RNA polymerase specialized sigma24 family protein